MIIKLEGNLKTLKGLKLLAKNILKIIFKKSQVTCCKA